jgi:hypothetical protein
MFLGRLSRERLRLGVMAILLLVVSEYLTRLGVESGGRMLLAESLARGGVRVGKRYIQI